MQESSTREHAYTIAISTEQASWDANQNSIQMMASFKAQK